MGGRRKKVILHFRGNGMASLMPFLFPPFFHRDKTHKAAGNADALPPLAAALVGVLDIILLSH